MNLVIIGIWILNCLKVKNGAVFHCNLYISKVQVWIIDVVVI